MGQPAKGNVKPEGPASIRGSRSRDLGIGFRIELGWKAAYRYPYFYPSGRSKESLTALGLDQSFLFSPWLILSIEGGCLERISISRWEWVGHEK